MYSKRIKMHNKPHHYTPAGHHSLCTAHTLHVPVLGTIFCTTSHALAVPSSTAAQTWPHTALSEYNNISILSKNHKANSVQKVTQRDPSELLQVSS